jgi:hypothetical protein
MGIMAAKELTVAVTADTKESTGSGATGKMKQEKKS